MRDRLRLPHVASSSGSLLHQLALPFFALSRVLGQDLHWRRRSFGLAALVGGREWLDATGQFSQAVHQPASQGASQPSTAGEVWVWIE